MNKKILFLIISILVIIIAGVFIWIFWPNKWDSHWELNPDEMGCTLEAKLCPDGSFVGRSGPNCEFAECPVVQTVADWKIYRAQKYGFEISYPADWYVSDIFTNWLKDKDAPGDDSSSIVLTEINAESENSILKEWEVEEWGLGFAPAFCTIDYAKGKQIIIRPAYLSDYKSFQEYIDYKNGETSPYAISSQGEKLSKAIYDLKMINNGYQYRIDWGFEGCTEHQKETYFPYSNSKMISGKEVTGLFIIMQDNEEGIFNNSLYDNFISTFKFTNQ